MFQALHVLRMSFKWFFSIIDYYIRPFLKHEPVHLNWTHIYVQLSSQCTTRLNFEKIFYTSQELYTIYPNDNDIAFIDEEYQKLHSVGFSIIPEYEPDTKQIPEVIGILFVSKKSDKYIFRKYPAVIPDRITTFPCQSSIEFVIVEYKHPQMDNSIVLSIPPGFYLVGNDLLGFSFVQRQLELQSEYYVFDADYEIHVIDQNCQTQILTYNEYITIEKDGYTIRNETENK